jgi:hypothetical protein
MLRQPKCFAEATLPPIAGDGVARLPRDDQTDPRMIEFVFAGVENEHPVALRAATCEDAVELRLLQQSPRTVEGKVGHLADRFVAIDRRRLHSVDVGLRACDRRVGDDGLGVVIAVAAKRQSVGRN